MARTSSTLTDMQHKFVQHYLIFLNAKKAAIAAGYSESTAEVQGSQLLKHPLVLKAVKKAMAKRAARLELTAENVLREIARLAFSDVRDVMSFDGEKVEFRDSDCLHPDAAATIQSVQSETKTRCIGPDGDTEKTITLKMKMHDKLKALDLVGRHLGLWLPDAEDDQFKKMSLKDLVRFVTTTLEANKKKP